MTDEEKKQPEGDHRPGMFAIRLLLLTLICAFSFAPCWDLPDGKFNCGG